jgi:hypothetical protein
MHTIWHHIALIAARIFTLVIVISLVILPVSMSHASISGTQNADSVEISFASHYSPVTFLLKNKVDGQNAGQNTGLEADCDKKNAIDADNGGSCCSTFSSAFNISDSYALGSVFGNNAIASALVRQLSSEGPEAPHRPPNS